MRNVILAVLGLVLILLLAATVLPGIVDETVADDYFENFSVATGAGETTTTETLTYDHYYGDLTDLSATSDNENDTPVIMDYDEDTKEVSVAGLQASASRILTIDYVREANQQFPGFSGFVRLTPFILIIAGVAACLWGLFSAWKSRG